MSTLAAVLDRFLPVPLMGIGVILVLLGTLQMVDWVRVARWPTTIGVIIESGAKREEVASRTTGPSTGVRWVPNIRVRFQVNGTSVESETFSNRPPRATAYRPDEPTPANLQAAADRHPVGQQVTVRYNPKRPSMAYVEYDVDGLRLIAYGALLLLSRLFILPALLKSLRA